jgi:hypothetical protein
MLGMSTQKIQYMRKVVAQAADDVEAIVEIVRRNDLGS